MVTPSYLGVVSALDIPILVRDVLSSFMVFACVREVGDKFRWGPFFFIHFEHNFFLQLTPVLLLTGLLRFMVYHHCLATAPMGLSRTHQAPNAQSPKSPTEASFVRDLKCVSQQIRPQFCSGHSSSPPLPLGLVGRHLKAACCSQLKSH